MSSTADTSACWYSPDSEEESTQTSSRRRVRTSGDAKWAKTRGVRGLLSCIVDFPQDIVYEIFCYLHPRDILQLSRTTRDLRAFLMTTSASTIWKAVRLNVEIEGLPDCPPDLNEAQFMDLIFFTHCTHCLAPQSMKTILWNCRARACTSCFSKYYGRVDDYDYQDYGHLNSATISGLIHTDLLERRKNGVTEEYEVFCYRMANEFNADVDQINQLEILEPQLSSKQFEDWLDDKERDATVRQNHSILCVNWMIELEEYRQVERERLREIRTERILERLCESGWGVEIEAQLDFEGLDFLTSEKVFKDTKPLTDRMWSNMESGLIELLLQKQEYRLNVLIDAAWKERFQTFAALVQKHLDSLAHNVLMPPIADILASPSFETILAETPIEEAITANSLQAAFSQLPVFTVAWIHQANADLVELLHEAGLEDATSQDLSLAKIMFQCIHCSDMVRHPRILVHSEFCTGHVRYQESGYYDAASLLSHLRLRTWSAKPHYTVDVRGMNFRKALVRACGLNPNTASADAMNELCPIVKAEIRSSKYRYYHWETLDLMSREARHALEIVGFSVIPIGSLKYQAAILHGPHKPSIPVAKNPWMPARKKVICCKYCSSRVVPSELPDHMDELHGRGSVSPDDWTWHLDTPSSLRCLSPFRFRDDGSDSDSDN